MVGEESKRRSLTTHSTGRLDSMLFMLLPAAYVVCWRSARVNSSVGLLKLDEIVNRKNLTPMGKYTAPTKGYETSFVIKIAISSSVAYLWATVPQVYVDPLLTHHVKFPSRDYPNAFRYIIPLCLITFLFTLMAMRKRRSTLLSILPFIIAVVASIPIFMPEIPHGNLVTVGFIWIVLATLTLWIHNHELSSSIVENIKSPNLSDKTARIEYLKEEVQFWRILMVGFAGGYIALLISWASFIMSLNKAIVGGNEAEAFVLNMIAAFGLGLCSIGLIIGPLAEASKKHRQALNLFLKIKEKES